MRSCVFPCGSGAAFIYVVCFPEVWPRPRQSFWIQAPFTARGVAWYLELWMKPCVCSERWSHVFTETTSDTVLLFFTRCRAAKLTFKWDSLKHYLLFFSSLWCVYVYREPARWNVSFYFVFCICTRKKKPEISSINLNWALMFAAWMRRLRLQRLFFQE